MMHSRSTISAICWVLALNEKRVLVPSLPYRTISCWHGAKHIRRWPQPYLLASCLSCIVKGKIGPGGPWHAPSLTVMVNKGRYYQRLRKISAVSHGQDL